VVPVRVNGTSHVVDYTEVLRADSAWAGIAINLLREPGTVMPCSTLDVRHF